MPLDYILLLLCLLFSAFFSGAETAFTSLSSIQIISIKETKGKRGILIERFMKRYEQFLITVLVGNTFANVAASVISTRIALVTFGNNALGYTTGIITFIILIFCEFTPKRLAIIKNEWFAIHTIRSLYFISIILYPITSALLVCNRLFMKTKTQTQTMTLEGLNYLIGRAEAMGVLEKARSQIVRNTFMLGSITIAEAMTHRQDVFSLDSNTPLSDALNAIIERNFSRIPIYTDDEENIVGILNIKLLLRNINKAGISLKDCMIPPLFVASHKKLTSVLNLFLQEKTNMAIVLDEYGGLAGIVTIEDVLEEIVGEIYDEHENPTQNKLTVAGPGRYKVLGKASLSTLQHLVPHKLRSARNHRTVSGYLTSFLGHIPTVGERATTPIGLFTIHSVHKQRVVSVFFEPNTREESPQ